MYGSSAGLCRTASMASGSTIITRGSAGTSSTTATGSTSGREARASTRWNQFRCSSGSRAQCGYRSTRSGASPQAILPLSRTCQSCFPGRRRRNAGNRRQFCGIAQCAPQPSGPARPALAGLFLYITARLADGPECGDGSFTVRDLPHADLRPPRLVEVPVPPFPHRHQDFSYGTRCWCATCPL